MPMTHELLRAIEAAHDKLAYKYYGKTEGTGTFYNIGATLNHIDEAILYMK
jgi:hypothetical protein